ncbi:MAG TPA: hypothetical protein VFC63_12395 [Blastocatellia bacterium]|nr:hypothetical protein [Blastocatellia bacterium]
MSSASATIVASLRKVSSSARKFELRPYEVAAVLVTALAVISLGVYYFVTLVPAKSRVDKLQTEKIKNKTEIEGYKIGLTEVKDPGAQTKQALDSLQQFNQLLPSGVTGQNAILTEINDLARENKIAITDALKFTKIDETPLDAPQSQRRENMSVYPGLSLDLGVQGNYKNLREFISKLEHSRNFLVLNAIELVPIDPQQQQTRGGVRTTTRGPKSIVPIENVALRIKLDAYFKR